MKDKADKPKGPRQYRASQGSIIDLDTLGVVAYVQPVGGSTKLCHRLAKLAVDRLNAEARGEFLAKQYDRHNKVKP